MKRSHIWMLTIVISVFSQGIANGDIVEAGDLNIIVDAGNPSDGLRYLDMDFSVGLTSAAAVANAQLTYANSRLATPDEFDDVFAAAGIQYDGALTASDGFTPGATSGISSLSNYNTSLLNSLGITDSNGPRTIILTDPDLTGNTDTTRDVLILNQNSAVIFNSGQFTNPVVGWLIVSEAVPEPSSCLCLLGLSLIGLTRRQRN